MWRLANNIYRAFRSVVSHRYSQDIVVPITTIHKKDNDESSREKKQETLIQHKLDFDRVIKTSQLSFENLDKLRKHIFKNSLQQLILTCNVIKPIELPNIELKTKESSTSSTTPNNNEESIESLLQKDENTLKSLSDLNEETMSIMNNESAVEAFEAGNFQLGVEKLQLSIKTVKNPAALYNLGICYEQGIGVEKDFFKACDYYRQAANLGHVNAFINLSVLSNCVDFEEEDEDEEQTISNKLHEFTFSPSEDSQIWNRFQIDLSKTLTCVS